MIIDIREEKVTDYKVVLFSVTETYFKEEKFTNGIE